MSFLKPDILEASGSLQLCAGQPAGCEAAIHAMRSVFSDSEHQAVLLVDAHNAFNTLHRKTALHNIRILCPLLSIILINTYRAHVNLYITGGEHMFSCEGTTQGDPLAMAMYAIALQPLITHLDGFAVQVWYADDASCAGSVADVKTWWDEMVITGGCFGYNVNPRKTWLIVKESQCDVAVEMFKSSSIQITTHGKRHLGAALGHRSFVEEYVGAQVKEWVEQIHRLAKVAVTQPHTAYSAFVHGLAGRWTFPLLLPLEEAIHHHLIPALTGRDTCGPAERELLSMPIRLGGLGIIDPSKQASHEFSTSTTVTCCSDHGTRYLLCSRSKRYSQDQGRCEGC